MNTVLRNIVEHHIWANDTLLAFCEGLSDEQLALTVPGTYGPVLKTLVHIAEAEQVYLSRIPDTGIVRTLDDEAEPLPSVPEIRAAVSETGAAWRVVVDRWPDDLLITYTRQGNREHRSVSFTRGGVWMARNTSVTLGDHFESFVDEQVQSGRYGSVSEVIRDGLRLLEDRDRQLAWLRDQIAIADEQVRNGQVHVVNETFWEELNREVDERLRRGEQPSWRVCP